MSAAKRVVIYVDDETYRLDLASTHVPSGVVLEVRIHCREGNRHFINPVVTEVTAGGQVSCVDTRIEP